MPTVHLDAFDVPPAADADFLADWAAAATGAVLHRALRDDTQPRYLAVAEDARVASGADARGAVGSGADARGADASGGPASGAAYAVVHADGEGAGAGGCLLLERFTPGDDGFAGAWRALHALRAARRGHLGARLLARPGDLVALTRWSSPLMHQRAEQDPDVAAALAALPRLETTLYRPV